MEKPEESAQDGQVSSAHLSFTETLRKPTFKYVGFALLLAWHYSLWFVPHAFVQYELLDLRVTIAWLVNLAAVVVFLFLISAFLGRKRRLSNFSWLFTAAPLATCALTLALCIPYAALETPAVAYGLSTALGATEAVQWILWGERYACIKANFSIRHIGTTFGITLFLVVAIAWVLPPYVSTIFTALLPIASGALLVMARKDNMRSFPPLLPKSGTRDGVKNMVIVSSISFVASIACYFLAAIIPWELLPTQTGSFTFGILAGGIIMLLIAGIVILSKDKLNIFKMYPSLLVLIIIGFALYLADVTLYFPAFVVALGVSSLFEILLIMYFGILTSKGYTTPAFAFAFSGGFIRAGIGIGNVIAIGFEHSPSSFMGYTTEVSLALMVILAMMLIPLVRKEFDLLGLMSSPPPMEEMEVICAEVAQEYGLSTREHEILVLISRGYTANSMAEKLVISPYTVNTHIRHIYDKMQIHKRSELLNYLNMQRSDY